LRGFWANKKPKDPWPTFQSRPNSRLPKVGDENSIGGRFTGISTPD
jgi:hypothetical protein